jgi:hypothetical protein
MIEFLLKASTILGVALLFYKLLLQRETFFSANRLFFVGFLVLAFLSPFISLPQLIKHQGYLSKVFEPAIVPVETKPVLEKKAPLTAEKITEESPASPAVPIPSEIQKTTINESENTYDFLPATPGEWLFALYFFGVIVFTLNLVVQTGNILYKIIHNRDKIRDGNYVIVNLRSAQAPCSFFHYIFIHPDSYDLETYEQIIAHEKIHASRKHSWDLLIAEIGVIILWFNPLTWIYKNEIEKNIEYETDSILLRNEEIKKDQYQFNLLQIAAPNKPLAITTNYNQSLLKQRIVMMNAKKSTLSSYWKYSFVLPLFLAAVLLLNKPLVGQAIQTTYKTDISLQNDMQSDVTAKINNDINTQVNTDLNLDLKTNANTNVDTNVRNETQTRTRVRSINIINGDEDMTHGFWYGYQTETEYCIEFKGAQNSSRWNISTCFPKTSFTKSGDNTFTMTKETGTLVLTGALDQEVSQGKYVFTKDASFENFLSQNNLLKSERNIMFHLFLSDVTKNYVQYLKGKFRTLNADDLLSMAIHEVTQEYIEGLERAGFKGLEADKIVTAKIHGVTPENIKEMRALGFGDLDLDEMVSLRIHGVDKKYIEDLKAAGFTGLDLDKIVQAKIHGVNPETVKEIKALGFEDLNLDKIMELRIHGVNAAYIADLKSAGFKDLDLDNIIQGKIHGLNSKSIKEIQSLGFKDLSFDKITEMKIHGLDAAFLKDLKESGISDLTIDQAMEAKIHGLSGRKIKEIRGLGYDNISFRKMMDAQIHGVNKDFIEGIKRSGIKNPEFNDIISAKIHGVNETFIKDAKKDGYDYDSIDEYINLKIHGMMRRSKKKDSE